MMSARENVAELIRGAHEALRSVKPQPRTEAERETNAYQLGAIQARLEMAIYRLTGAWPTDCVMPEGMRACLADTLPMPPESDVRKVGER